MKSEQSCWICGALADSREHKIKKSDLVRRHGNGPYKGTVQHFNGKDSNNIPGPNSKILRTYPTNFCTHINMIARERNELKH